MTINHPECQPGSSRFLAVLSWLSAIGSLGVLVGLLLYMRCNHTNHTGIEPWLFSVVFAPTAVLGVTALLRGNSPWGAILACGLGIGGMAFLFCLDYFNILVEYDRWCVRGMP